MLREITGNIVENMVIDSEVKKAEDVSVYEKSSKVYEEKFHSVNMTELNTKTKEYRELCETFIPDRRQIEKAVEAVDQALNELLAALKEIPLVASENTLKKEDLEKILKNLDKESVVPAISYWLTLQKAIETGGEKWLEKVNNPDASEKETEKQKHREGRQRMVTELLIMTYPPAFLARCGYQLIKGKEPEVLNKIDNTVSKLIVDTSDAMLYLTGCAALGGVKAAENAIEYVGATGAKVAGKNEAAEKIISTDVAGLLKDKLDDLYGRDNWVQSFGNTVEMFGTTASYIGLTVLLSAGGPGAVAGGITLALATAGEVTKKDFEKTGELSYKELLHGAAAGALSVGFAELGMTFCEKLNGVTPEIARDLYELLGKNIDPKLLANLTSSIVKGLEAGISTASYEIPTELTKSIERWAGIDPEVREDWLKVLGDAGASMLCASVFALISELKKNGDFYSSYQERIAQTPASNGKWSGERGESVFVSDSEKVAEYMKKAGVEGVSYKDGCPDFSPFSKGDVKIPSMSSERYARNGIPGNFEQADAKLAELRGCTPREVADWRKLNNYTWHELNDMKTCQKIPQAINSGFGHLGGCGECKRGEEMLLQIIGKTKEGVFDV